MALFVTYVFVTLYLAPLLADRISLPLLVTFGYCVYISNNEAQKISNAFWSKFKLEVSQNVTNTRAAVQIEPYASMVVLALLDCLVSYPHILFNTVSLASSPSELIFEITIKLWHTEL